MNLVLKRQMQLPNISKKKVTAVVNGDIKTAKETSQNAKLKSAVSTKDIIHVQTAVTLPRVIPFKNFTTRNPTSTKNTKKRSSLFNGTVMQSL